jgi:hypothetical protein
MSLARGQAPRQFNVLLMEVPLESAQATEDHGDETLVGTLLDLNDRSIGAENPLSLSLRFRLQPICGPGDP